MSERKTIARCCYEILIIFAVKDIRNLSYKLNNFFNKHELLHKIKLEFINCVVVEIAVAYVSNDPWDKYSYVSDFFEASK